MTNSASMAAPFSPFVVLIFSAAALWTTVPGARGFSLTQPLNRNNRMLPIIAHSVAIRTRLEATAGTDGEDNDSIASLSDSVRRLKIETERRKKEFLASDRALKVAEDALEKKVTSHDISSGRIASLAILQDYGFISHQDRNDFTDGSTVPGNVVALGVANFRKEFNSMIDSFVGGGHTMDEEFFNDDACRQKLKQLKLSNSGA